MKQLLIIFSVVYTPLLGMHAQETEPEEILLQAELLTEKKSYNESIEVLEQFVDEHPNRRYDIATAYYLMSKNYFFLKQYEGAIWTNEESYNIRNQIQAESQLVENCLQFGAIYIAQNEYDHALDYLETALNLPFEDPEIFANINYNLAKLLQSKGAFIEADRYYDNAAQILSIEFGDQYERLIPIYLQRIKLYLAMNQYEEVAALMAKVKKLTNENGVSLMNYLPILREGIAEASLGSYPSRSSCQVIQSFFVDALKLIH